jgi:crotonobetaine/carnitine-CoA ligase
MNATRWHDYDVRDLTVDRVLERQAARRGENIYLRTAENGRGMTYADVHRETNRMANWMTSLGIRQATHVAVMMDNVPQCLLVHIALAKLGAVSVPINVNARGAMLAHYLSSADAAAFVATPVYAERLLEINAQLALMRTLIVVGDDDWSADGCGMRVARLKDCAAAPDSPPGVEVRFSDLAFIMFTSGTTGPSKGVMFTQARAFLWDEGVVSHLGINSSDTYFVCTPLSHAAGLFSGAWMMMALGGAVALTARFSASKFWDEVRATGATFTTLLGAMVQFIESLPPRPDDADTPMRMISTGPYPKTWASFEKRFGLDLVSGYGLSDHSAPTKLRPGAPVEKRGSSGQVIDAFEMMVVDESDLPVDPGVTGECLLRSKYPWRSSSGYYKLPEQTAASRRNEWFHTGDRGYLDADGYFWFVERAKDAIRRRGENISAYEVEQLAGSHPDIAEIAAYPLRADEAEDEVAVSVVPKSGRAIDAGELARYCLDRMPKFMAPRFIHVTDALPRNLNLRVEKYKLIAWAESNRQAMWDRETTDEFSGRPRRQ